MFKVRSFYKFSINGKTALILATSVLNAMDIIESEGFTSYAYMGKVG